MMTNKVTNNKKTKAKNLVYKINSLKIIYNSTI